ncbi:MAG: hypothetical protein ACO1SV_11075 [Fimbriimonas sp.]
MADLLGRTNRAFPPVWLSLSLPDRPDAHDELIAAALASGAPIDVTSQPGLWGGRMRGTDAILSCVSSSHFEDAHEESHATDLVQAHLIETLSCIGREYFDFYFLRVRRGVEEYQISGALQAMELARQEGHIRYLGICCDGPSLATMGVWQFHDAFDVLLVPRNHYDSEPYDTLAPMAKERRVGIVTSRPLNWGYGLPFAAIPARLAPHVDPTLAPAIIGAFAKEHPVMVGVRSAEEVRLAVEAPKGAPRDDLGKALRPYLDGFDSEEEWSDLLLSEQPHLRAAAQRRGRENGL